MMLFWELANFTWKPWIFLKNKWSKASNTNDISKTDVYSDGLREKIWSSNFRSYRFGRLLPILVFTLDTIELWRWETFFLVNMKRTHKHFYITRHRCRLNPLNWSLRRVYFCTTNWTHKYFWFWYLAIGVFVSYGQDFISKVGFTSPNTL